ncbi:retrovirus-related pol polyprotein from transposon TNT 1-94 [Tanacetum coccineum]
MSVAAVMLKRSKLALPVLQGFREARKLKQGALYLYVGNGVRAQVEAIGSYDLVLPNGLVICLDNCHYAPSITRGVVSVHRLVENGFVQCFTDFGISVSKNNVFYFNAIPSNGIYEIDMHDLVPNVNSIYNVSTKRAKHNLDSTYLWHYRLAHISKKRIERLQQEGLLKSTDDESFDQYVSCLSGKMTRKSFPHRPKRATDLLGIIHTDVCGPLRHVSRQGASYFITFTDDYSRYGYVYLLKHKHEQLTPPYTPQHNGVSERRNRTLLDMVRSMMNLTTLSLSFWDYAIESATRILNMVPTKKVDKTPYELWYGKVPNLSYLKVWGCEALVKRDTPDNGRRAIDLEEIQDEDTSPSESWGNSMEVEEAEEHSLGDLNEPTSYIAAMLDLESNMWIDAMNAEIQSLMRQYGMGTGQYSILGCKIVRLLGFYSILAYEIMANGYKTNLLKMVILMKDIYMVQPEGFPTPKEVKRMQNVPYASAVGSIMYAVRCTRPDVAFAQNITSQFQQNLGECYWTTVKNILKYLRNTKDMFLVYGGNPKAELRVDYYCNAGFETDIDDMKSLTGYLNYIAASEAEMEAVWIRKFISGLGIVPTINEPIRMFCDNSAALHFANKPGVQKGTRHYHRRYHYVHGGALHSEIVSLMFTTDDSILADHCKKLYLKESLLNMLGAWDFNGLSVVPGIANQHGNGNVVAARAEGNANGNNGNQIRCYNCQGEDHLACNCTVKPGKQDAAYLQKQMQIALKEEAGIQLTQEEFDFMADAGAYEEIERVNANCTLKDNLQQASTSGTQTDKAPVYDSDESAEVHHSENCYDNDIFNMFTQEEQYTELLEPIPESHQVPQNDSNVISEVSSVEQSGGTVEQHPATPEETRALYDSLYNNLATEVEKVNSVNRKLRETNADLTTELARYKNQEKFLLEKHDPPVVYDSEETLELAQESPLKMNQLNKEIKPANYTKINHLSGGFVFQTAKSRKEFSFLNTSKTANVSKSFSIPNEDFSDDTTPSVARKFLNEVKSTIVTLQRIVKQKMTLDIHNWSSSAHQEIHKIVKNDIFPIVNQVDARVQNFKIQFLKEAVKFVRDFQSLAKEADESLAKHTALELEIERLLRAVVSQDILSIVQNNSVIVTSNLQTELERTKERFENCIIKKENEYVNFGKIGTKNVKNSNMTKFRMIKLITTCNKRSNGCKLSGRSQGYKLSDKVSEQNDTTNGVFPKIEESHALSKTSHFKNLVLTPQESKVVKNDKVIAPGIFRINPFKTSREEKPVPNKPTKASVRTKPITISQPHVITKKDVNSDSNGLSSTGIENTAKTRRPHPRSNTKHIRVFSASKSSCIKNKEVEVEEHHRNLLLSKNKK